MGWYPIQSIFSLFTHFLIRGNYRYDRILGIVGEVITIKSLSTVWLTWPSPWGHDTRSQSIESDTHWQSVRLPETPIHMVESSQGPTHQFVAWVTSVRASQLTFTSSSALKKEVNKICLHSKCPWYRKDSWRNLSKVFDPDQRELDESKGVDLACECDIVKQRI